MALDSLDVTSLLRAGCVLTPGRSGSKIAFSPALQIQFRSWNPDIIGHNNDRRLRISTPIGIEEKEGSRRRRTWAEGWEEDRKTGLRILQAATSETKAP